MQAVILAAGESKRLRPLTNSTHKGMLPLCGEPILAHTLSILPVEIDEVVFVIGFFGEHIKNYFGAAEGGRRFRYVRQSAPKGTAHALTRARRFLKKGKFLVLSGDDLYSARDLEKCIRDDDELVVLAKRVAEPQNFGICVTDEDGFLIEMPEKPEDPPSDLANIGVYLLDHAIFDEPEVVVNGESYLAPQIGTLGQKRPIKVVEADFWHPINRPQDYETAEQALAILKST